MTATIDITSIVLAVITLIASIITTFVIPFLKERYTNEQLAKACTWVEIAVNSAEQLMKKGELSPEQRKEYAMNFLLSKRLKLDFDQLDAMVEAYVLELPKSMVDTETTSEEVPDNK